MLKDTPLDTMTLISQSLFKCKKNIEEEYEKLEREKEFKNEVKNEFIDFDDEEYLRRRLKALDMHDQTVSHETETDDDDYAVLLRRFAALEASHSFDVNTDENLKDLQARQPLQKKTASTIIETEEEKELRTRLDSIKRNYPPTPMNIEPDELAMRILNLRG